MVGWKAEVRRAIGLAIAPNTKRAYDRAVTQFEAFRHKVGYRNLWPVPVDHLLHFCVASKGKGLAISSIRGMLSAVAHASKAKGVAEYTGDFQIRKTLEGWSREVGVRVDHRQPISPEILRGLQACWGEICSSVFEAVLFHAAALVAFFGAFRISELVAQAKSDTSGRALQVQDVELSAVRASIALRRSKTDQQQRGVVVKLGTCAEKELCPVSALAAYLAVRGRRAGLLFQHQDGSPLTKHQFWSVTARALEKLGLAGKRFCTHSFRIGAASTAAAMGYPAQDIQRLGRWRSKVFRSYVRPLDGQ